MWIFKLACLVFKTTCVDRRIPLREGAFFFMEIALSLLLDKRNMCAEAKGLLGHFGEGYREVGGAMP